MLLICCSPETSSIHGVVGIARRTANTGRDCSRIIVWYVLAAGSSNCNSNNDSLNRKYVSLSENFKEHKHNYPRRFYRWGSYQIDVFIYRSDEHRQKFNFWDFFFRDMYMYDRQTTKLWISRTWARTVCLMVVGIFFRQVKNVRQDMKYLRIYVVISNK